MNISKLLKSSIAFLTLVYSASMFAAEAPSQIVVSGRDAATISKSLLAVIGTYFDDEKLDELTTCDSAGVCDYEAYLIKVHSEPKADRHDQLKCFASEGFSGCVVSTIESLSIWGAHLRKVLEIVSNYGVQADPVMGVLELESVKCSSAQSTCTVTPTRP